ncbi:ESCRT-III subunit protein snf7 [Nowakowskiella sp. JEL0407]|nr:ESCRT-III subunit protein snf7 [Nowakowskiella sp. JEL0407]
MQANGLNTNNSGWEQLRKQARQLENDIESKLVAFSRAGGSMGSSGLVVGIESNLNGNNNTVIAENEIEGLLKKVAFELTSVVDSMATHLDSSSSGQSNPSMMHMLQRHRDILYDYTKEFGRTKDKILAVREQADFLHTIRNDIESYKTGNGANSMDYLLIERGKIDNSHKMTDMVIEQAYDTKEALDKQRSQLFGTRSRFGNVISRFPAINNVVNKIKTKKQRDTIILAANRSLFMNLSTIAEFELNGTMTTTRKLTDTSVFIESDANVEPLDVIPSGLDLDQHRSLFKVCLNNFKTRCILSLILQDECQVNAKPSFPNHQSKQLSSNSVPFIGMQAAANLFSRSRKSKQSPKEAIAKLKEVQDNLDKLERKLQSDVDQQLLIAKQNATKNKRVALAALKKKKMLQDRLDKVMGTRTTIDMQVMTIENANFNLETMNAMRAGADALKTLHGKMDINKVDETMDVIQDQMQIADEISNAISQPVGFGVDIDEDELDAELQLLEQEQLDEAMLTMPKTSIGELPEVPAAPVPTKSENASLEINAKTNCIFFKAEQVADDEDAEIAELKAMMSI